FDAFNQPSPLQRQNTNLGLIGANYQHNQGPYLNLTTGYTYTRFRFHSEDPNNIFFPLSDNQSGDTRITVQNDAHLGQQNILTAGYEFEHENVTASDITGTYINDLKIDDNALFVQDKFEAGPWILVAGLRWDNYNTFGDSVNPRISGAYKIREDIKVRASYGRAFRAPAAGELALPFYGNPDLKPEKSNSWAVGIDKYWGATGTIGFSWFDSHYEDLITFDPVTLIAQNIAKARVRGFEISGSQSWNRWTFAAGYTYLDTEDETTGLQLFRRPKNSGSASISYDASRWGASMALVSVGQRLENDFSTFPPQLVFNQSFTTVAVAGYYQIVQQLKLTGRIENLFDKEYQEVLTFPAPGIGFYGGIKASF